MTAPSHYTKKPVERSQQKRQTQNEEGARARLVDELETHYDKTWTLELCCREGLDWRAMYQLDVMHEDPDPNLTDEARELETPRAQKILELVEDAVSTLELEASVDGASRVCVRGWPERRGRRALFEVPWIAGSPMLPSESRMTKAEAEAAGMATLARSLDGSLRWVDRLAQRVVSMADSSGRYHEATLKTQAALIEAQAKLEAPSVERAKLELELRRATHSHVEKMEEDRSNDELMLRGMELIAKGLDAQRRDRREDKDFQRWKEEQQRRENGSASTADPIDTTASESSSSSSSSNGASSSTSNGSSNGERRRFDPPKRERCSDAADLLGVLKDMSESDLAKARKELLTDDEWSAIAASCDASTQAAFDASFGVLYDLWIGRGREALTEMRLKLVELTGMGGGMTMQRIIVTYERRRFGNDAPS